MKQSCALCESGFPLDGQDHIPTQRLGMIPRTRCRRHVDHRDVKRFRLWLNFTYANSLHRNGRFKQRTREYGDYLYHQDRQKFMVDLCEWLPIQP